MALNLDDVEQIGRVLLDPIVAAVKAEIGTLVSRVEKVEANESDKELRLQKLEGYARRLGTLYSGLIAAGTFAAHWGWGKLNKYF